MPYFLRIPLASALTFLVATPAHAQGGLERPGYWHHDWGWGHMFFGSLMMLLVWGGIILLVVVAVRWLRGHRDAMPPGSKSALEVLDERYARGEIDSKEYEERKRTLSQR